MTTPVLTSTPLSAPQLSTPISVDEYHRMIDSGVLAEDGQYELIRGRIVRKMTKNPPHVLANDNTKEALGRELPDGWYIRTQDPITLTDSEPEPDIVVAAGCKQDYGDRHPGACDVALVVEIADSSLANDRRKASVYASDGIASYWIVNLLSGCVEVLTQPQGQGEAACYAKIATYHAGERIAFSIEQNASAEVLVDELLP